MLNMHQLLKTMIENGASDLHISTGSAPQIRVDGQMVVLKKIIGNYARRFSDRSETFGGLSITIKAVNETEAGAVYEICATLMDGEKQKDADCKETNIFIAVDSVLKKIEND